MRYKLLALAALIGLSAALAASSPAEAGWKWKKMKWVPKHGQEYRSPYAHSAPHGYGRGGYGGPRYERYGYDRYNHGHRFGYGRPGYGPRHDFEW